MGCPTYEDFMAIAKERHPGEKTREELIEDTLAAGLDPAQVMKYGQVVARVVVNMIVQEIAEKGVLQTSDSVEKTVASAVCAGLEVGWVAHSKQERSGPLTPEVVREGKPWGQGG